MSQAMGGMRAAVMRVLGAHRALLQAELAVVGKELGIIIGLAVGALVIAILVGILLYVGTFLFLGEWLFGSMGWGIIHGTLMGAVVIAFVGINLAGGDISRYGIGALVGLIVAVILALLLLSNVGNESGEWMRDRLHEAFVTEDLPFGEEWLVTLSGLVIVGIVGALAAIIGGWRSSLRGRPLVSLVVVGFVLGGFVGAIYASTRYEAPDGVLGLVVMVGLITWIITGVLLAVRKGFDAEARYADLVPRESIGAAKQTRAFLEQQWRHLKRRMLSR